MFSFYVFSFFTNYHRSKHVFIEKLKKKNTCGFPPKSYEKVMSHPFLYQKQTQTGAKGSSVKYVIIHAGCRQGEGGVC